MLQAALDTIADPVRLTLLQHRELLDNPPKEACDRFTKNRSMATCLRRPLYR